MENGQRTSPVTVLMDSAESVGAPVVFTDVTFLDEFLEENPNAPDYPAAILFETASLDAVFSQLKERGISWSKEAERRIRNRVREEGKAEVV